MCDFVGGWVGVLVGWSVGWSVGRSVCQSGSHSVRNKDLLKVHRALPPILGEGLNSAK